MLNLIVLYMIPKIKEIYSQENIFFILIGFSKKGFNKCLDQLNNKDFLINNPNQNIFSFVKSKEKEKMLQLFFNKVENFKEEVEKNFNKNNFIIFDDIYDDKNETILEDSFFKGIENFLMKNKIILHKKEKNYECQKKFNSINFEKLLIVFVPLGIPGMGKSFFKECLEEYFKENLKNWFFNYISSDEVI